MALITDPDSLIDSAADDASTEVYINPSAKTIKLTATDNLSTDGVTLKALYSFLKEEWKDDPNSKNLPAFEFPIEPLGDETYELRKGWDFANDASRYLIRNAGWTCRNSSDAVIAMWAGVIGLGAIEAGDQVYFWQGGATTPTNFQLTGQVNQAVQILSDPNGDGAYGDGFDRRTSLTIYVREQGQVFGKASLTDIGVTTMQSIAYRFPLSTATDLKIEAADTDIKATGSGYPADVSPYSGMSITYHATPQSQSGFSGGSYNFGITVDGNGQTLREVYEFVQYALRQNSDINADTPTAITGKIADPLMYYVGDTLYTQAATNPDGGGTGVYITDFDSQDVNGVYMVDNTGTARSYPYVASLTLNFNDNLVNDPAGEYWVYYTTTPDTDDWGEATAVIVDDASAADMVGAISGASIVRTFDFDGNVQGGRAAPAVPDITVVGIGTTTGQYVKATGTIARSKSNVVSLVAPLERTYST